MAELRICDMQVVSVTSLIERLFCNGHTRAERVSDGEGLLW
jgi:hypothetical protein